MLLQARTAASPGARRGRVSPSLQIAAGPTILIGLIILAAALRFATISSQSYWLDESQAAHELSLSFGGMLHAWSSAEWNPPLYLILAWPWAKLFGTGEAGLRSLSALLGVGLVPLLYLAGRELVSRRAGLVAAGLAAVNPFMIWYSQEAREYMLLVVLSTASLLFFARSWRRGSRRDLTWWAVLSALALLTQYFAGFLVAAEGLALVYRHRNRSSVLALAAQAVVLAPFVPHVIPRLQGHGTGFITQQALSLRVEQVPVSFALSQLYLGPASHYGLLGAAVVAGVVIALLVIGGDGRELSGAGIAAALAAVVLLVPLALALAGHDEYIARGLMPAWPPLAILLGAACTAGGARAAGAGLALVLGALFIFGLVTIESDPAYQKADLRGVAAALGSTTEPRAIAAYDGQFTTGPLSIFLPRVPWAGPGGSIPGDATPVTVSELDVIGATWQHMGRLPPQLRLISARTVDGYLVDRFALASPTTTTTGALAQEAGQLLQPSGGQPTVIIQHASA